MCLYEQRRPYIHLYDLLNYRTVINWIFESPAKEYTLRLQLNFLRINFDNSHTFDRVS